MTAATIGVLLAVSASLSAPAQPASSNQPTVVAEVVVYAHYIVRRTVGVAPTGAQIEVLSVTRHVRYDDLDLTDANDVTQLRGRINAAAKDACEQLDREYPSTVYLPIPADQDCVKSATAQALTLADKVIAAAR